MKDEAGFSLLVDTTGAPSCMKAERSLCDYEREYMPIFPVLPDWQQRAMEEKAELDARLDKLCDFFGTAAYRQLVDIERHLLSKQLEYMRDYAHILGIRIARFG